MAEKPKPKVAIVCDWLTNMGGAERVILELHKTFPDAPIYTSTFEAGNLYLFKNADVRTSWMQKLPNFLRKHQLLTIPRQWYFGHLKLKGYDVVISAGSTEAKAVRAPDGIHVNMCYTPTLFYWVKPDEYYRKDSFGVFSPLLKLGLKLLMPYVKRWDLKMSKRPDKMFAISTEVRSRIKKFYGRDSEILNPPTDIERFSNNYHDERKGFITWGRHVHHKRFDLAISACNDLALPLTIIGNGPDTQKLKDMSGPTITFKENVSDDDMVKYISKAEAFIFPNEEDFGIVAVEAQAAGTPVIAYKAGGSLDTVAEGVTGEYFTEQTTECLVEALENFNYKLYNQKAIVDQAKKFSAKQFQKRIKQIVRDNSPR